MYRRACWLACLLPVCGKRLRESFCGACHASRMQARIGKRNTGRSNVARGALHFGFALLTMVGLGCGAARPQQVVRVATHDLGCDQVDVSEVGSDRYAAYGC